MTAVLEARDIVKRYGELTAVAGVSFEVRAGECYGLLGPNGAGKSTLFKLVTAGAAGVETTYGTFIRLVYQRAYDALLSTPITPVDAFVGELLFCALKGLVFTTCVLLVYAGFGAYQGWLAEVQPTVLLVPFVGALCAFLFGAIGLRVTASVKNINNFNFFFTGVLTPLSLFSGMVFPVSDLPPGLRELAYVLPVFHVTELNRLLMFGPQACVSFVGVCAPYLLLLTTVTTVVGIRAMERRIVQ